MNWVQCDQTARLFFFVWLFTTTQFGPKFIKIAKVGLNFVKLKISPQTFAQVAKFRQIWSHFGWSEGRDPTMKVEQPPA